MLRELVSRSYPFPIGSYQQATGDFSVYSRYSVGFVVREGWKLQRLPSGYLTETTIRYPRVSYGLPRRKEYFFIVSPLPIRVQECLSKKRRERQPRRVMACFEGATDSLGSDLEPVMIPDDAVIR